MVLPYGPICYFLECVYSVWPRQPLCLNTFISKWFLSRKEEL